MTAVLYIMTAGAATLRRVQGGGAALPGAGVAAAARGGEAAGGMFSHKEYSKVGGWEGGCLAPGAAAGVGCLGGGWVPRRAVATTRLRTRPAHPALPHPHSHRRTCLRSGSRSFQTSRGAMRPSQSSRCGGGRWAQAVKRAPRLQQPMPPAPLLGQASAHLSRPHTANTNLTPHHFFYASNPSRR